MILREHDRAVSSMYCALMALIGILLAVEAARANGGDEGNGGAPSSNPAIQRIEHPSSAASVAHAGDDAWHEAKDSVDVHHDLAALILGPVFFAAAYAGTVAAVAAEDGSHGRGPWDAMYVPLAGPVVFLVDHTTCFWPPCEVVADGLLILDEVLQLGGAAMFVVGLVPRTTVRVPKSSTSWNLSPITAPLRGGGSLWGLSGTF